MCLLIGLAAQDVAWDSLDDQTQREVFIGLAAPPQWVRVDDDAAAVRTVGQLHRNGYLLDRLALRPHGLQADLEGSGGGGAHQGRSGADRPEPPVAYGLARRAPELPLAGGAHRGALRELRDGLSRRKTALCSR